MRGALTLLSMIALAAAPAAAGTLVLPVFAHNAKGVDGASWSSEIYLTNPGDQPVQVTLSSFLPGAIAKPTPCDLFMAPTRVVPPHSAVVWTSSGLATDLGCAQTALGALLLSADGPIRITSRMVNQPGGLEQPAHGLLTGAGQAFEAQAVSHLEAGDYLLPALLWHRNACGKPAFTTSIGFANPGNDPVTVTLDLEDEGGSGWILLEDEEVAIPHTLTVDARSWRQIRLRPVDSPAGGCLDPEAFVVKVGVDGPLAIYASVVDRSTGDARTVRPVPLD